MILEIFQELDHLKAVYGISLTVFEYPEMSKQQNSILIHMTLCHFSLLTCALLHLHWP